MSAERAQGGRGWVRIPASRGEQPPPAATGKPYGQGQHGAYGGGQHGTYGPGRHGSGPYAATPFRGTGPYGPAGAGAGDPAQIYLSLVQRWREAGRTLPGHPDEEWERLISQPCWPGR